MSWLWLIPGLLVLLVIYLLTAPVYIDVNTNMGLYRLRFHRLFMLKATYTDGTWKTEVKFLWWSGTVKARGENKKPERKTKKRKALPWRKMVAVIKSFKVKRFRLALDSGDPALNGILYPLAWSMGYCWGQNISINFKGRNELVLEISNTLGRMAWVYIRTKN